MDNLRKNTVLILLLFAMVAVSVLLFSCSTSITAKDGDRVRVNYIGKLTDGKVFDSSEKQGKPLEFVIGSGYMIPGFDTAVKGMKVGETKEITIPTAEAYGEWKEELVQKLPRDKLQGNDELKKGDRLVVVANNGEKKSVKVIEVTEEYITVDLNPPLAGKILQFSITLEEIVK